MRSVRPPHGGPLAPSPSLWSASFCSDEEAISAENLKIVIQDLKEAFEQGKGRAMVVEVKGPRDRLSERQIVWLRKLQQSAGVEAHVCRVLEPRLKKKRKT